MDSSNTIPSSSSTNTVQILPPNPTPVSSISTSNQKIPSSSSPLSSSSQTYKSSTVPIDRPGAKCKVPTPPPPMDCTQSPQIVDLARCNHRRCWKSMARNLKMYFTCFKFMEKREKGESTTIRSESVNPRNVNLNVVQSPRNCSYYSEMNEEERDLNLKSVIVYCKDSTAHSQDE